MGSPYDELLKDPIRVCFANGDTVIGVLVDQDADTLMLNRAFRGDDEAVGDASGALETHGLLVVVERVNVNYVEMIDEAVETIDDDDEGTEVVE